MPINPLKQLMALAEEECDQAAVKSQFLGARHEQEAQNAGYDMAPYLAAKAANHKLVPKSKATTREKAMKEFANEKRALAQFIVCLRTKAKHAVENAEQEVDENVAIVRDLNDDAIKHGEAANVHRSDVAFHALALCQSLTKERAERDKQDKALHYNKAAIDAATEACERARACSRCREDGT